MFKITLRAARVACGYTEEEVAKHSGVSVDTLGKYEVDSGKMPISLIRKILNMYGVSSSFIYFGTEADCIEFNRSRVI
jgi:transcriptional regulator with XRE-family HTH domain